MSIEYMTKVFKTNLKPTPKLVLLTMADYANDDGKLFPSLKSLSEKASVGKSTLALILNVFEKLNIIKRVKRKRANGSDTSTLYTIQNLNKIDDNLYTQEYHKLRNYSKIKRQKTKQKIVKVPQCEHPNFHNVDTTQNPQCGHLESSIEEKEEYKKYIKKILNSKLEYEIFALEFYDYIYPKNKKANQQKIFYGNKVKENIQKSDIQTMDNIKNFLEYQELEKFKYVQHQKRKDNVR